MNRFAPLPLMRERELPQPRFCCRLDGSARRERQEDGIRDLVKENEGAIPAPVDDGKPKYDPELNSVIAPPMSNITSHKPFRIAALGLRAAQWAGAQMESQVDIPKAKLDALKAGVNLIKPTPELTASSTFAGVVMQMPGLMTREPT